MAFNGSGTFSLVAGNPVVTGTTISSTWANNTLSDIATNGLTNCITKDGQTTITANIPFNSNRITGLGGATAATDAPQVQQVQRLGFNTIAAVSGASTITGSVSPAPSSYSEGLTVSFTALAANAASPTLNLNSLGAALIFWNGATATASVWGTANRIDLVYLSTSESTASSTGFHVVGMSGFLPLQLLGTYAPLNSFVATRGQIFVGTTANQSGVIAAPSADDQTLVSTASNSNGAVWKNLSAIGASIVLISTTSASATAQVDIPITAGFASYRFEINGVVPSTDNTNFQLLASVDGGGTYLSSYNYAGVIATESGGTAVRAGSAAGIIQLGAGLGNNTGESWCGTLTLHSPSSALYKQIEGTFSMRRQDAVTEVGFIGGTIPSTSTVTHVRFNFSSGNTTAAIMLYGVRAI